MGEYYSSWGRQQTPGYGQTFPQGQLGSQLTGNQSQASSQQQYWSQTNMVVDPLGAITTQSIPTGVTNSGATIQIVGSEKSVYHKNERDVDNQISQSQSGQYHSQSGRDGSGISGINWHNTQTTEYNTQGCGSQFWQSQQNSKVDGSLSDRGSSHSRQHDREVPSGQLQPGQKIPDEKFTDVRGNTKDEHIPAEASDTQGVHHTKQDNLEKYSKTTPTIHKSYSEAVTFQEGNTELNRLCQTQTATFKQTGEKACKQDHTTDGPDGEDIQPGRNNDIQLTEAAVQTEGLPVKTVMVELPVITELQQKHAHCISQEEYQKLLKDFQLLLSDTLNKHEQEMHEMKQHYTRQIDDLSDRLSTEMNSKISSNETAIENISIKNRPTKIAEEYSGHCTSHWLEAKQYLDETYPDGPDTPKFKFLCDVLTFSEKIASTLQQQSENRIWQYFADPLNMSQDPGTAAVKEQLSQEMKNTISDLLRMMSDKVDIKRIVQGIQEELLKKWQKISGLLYDDHIVPYIEKSAQLAWKMANQRPVMTFHTTGIGDRFVDHYQEPQWGSSDPNDPRSVVQCYVHPVLAHGDKVLVKGKVYLKLKGKTGQ